jgi:ATP-dependent Zn protease
VWHERAARRGCDGGRTRSSSSWAGTWASKRNYSEKVASLIDDEVRRIIEDARATATRVLSERRQALQALAERLISEETVEADELDRIVEAAGRPRRRGRRPITGAP